MPLLLPLRKILFTTDHVLTSYRLCFFLQVREAIISRHVEENDDDTITSMMVNDPHKSYEELFSSQ